MILAASLLIVMQHLREGVIALVKVDLLCGVHEGHASAECTSAHAHD